MIHFLSVLIVVLLETAWVFMLETARGQRTAMLKAMNAFTDTMSTELLIMTIYAIIKVFAVIK